MPSTYTGNGANVAQTTSPTITVPADGDALSAASVNAALQKLNDQVALLWAGVFTGQTPTSPGLKAAAGGGASPARGALAATPQNAPSAPADGDIWVETTANVLKVRINGVTVTLPLQWWLTFMNVSSNVASTTFRSWTNGTEGGTVNTGPAGQNVVATVYIAPSAGVIKNLAVKTVTGTAGGTVSVQILVNSAVVGTTLTVSAGTAPQTLLQQAQSVSFNAGDYIETQVVNNVGVTTGIGAGVPISLAISSG